MVLAEYAACQLASYATQQNSAATAAETVNAVEAQGQMHKIAQQQYQMLLRETLEVN